MNEQVKQEARRTIDQIKARVAKGRERGQVELHVCIEEVAMLSALADMALKLIER